MPGNYFLMLYDFFFLLFIREIIVLFGHDIARYIVKVHTDHFPWGVSEVNARKNRSLPYRLLIGLRYSINNINSIDKTFIFHRHNTHAVTTFCCNDDLPTVRETADLRATH